MTESVVEIDFYYIIKTRNLCKTDNVIDIDGSGRTLKNQPHSPD